MIYHQLYVDGKHQEVKRLIIALHKVRLNKIKSTGKEQHNWTDVLLFTCILELRKQANVNISTSG